MKKVFLLFVLLFLFTAVLFGQAYQVSSTEDSYLLDKPKLDIQGASARVTFGTNFKCYVFPAYSPFSPITSPASPDPTAYGPTQVEIGGLGDSIFIPYIDYNTDSTRYDLLYVMSIDQGTHWSLPTFADIIVNGNSIDLTYPNLLFKVSDKNVPYCVWRNQIDTNIYFSSGFFLTGKEQVPIRITGQKVSELALETITSDNNDNLIIAYSIDTLLYIIRSTDGGNTFEQPIKIDSLTGMISHYGGLSITGQTDGTLFLSFAFFEMSMSFPPTDRFGSKLLKSTNYGVTWSAIDSVDNDMLAYPDLKLTGNGVLVSTYAENSNLYVKTSLDGREWSAPSRVNTDSGTAASLWSSFGYSTANIDNQHLGVAWVDTSTGRDEIFYRRMTLPIPVGIAEQRELIPSQFALLQNYPNPFNPTTKISFSLNHQSMVSLKLFDVLGREIKTLTSGEYQSGMHTITLDASTLPSGIYFYQLQTGNFTATRKLTLLK